MKLIVLGLMLLTVVSGAKAAITGESYEKMRINPQQREWIRAYVFGVGAAYEAINVQIEVGNKGKPLYCPPDNLVMNNQNYIDVLELRLAEIAKMKVEASFTKGYIVLIEAELLRGLQKTFPCK